MNDRSHITSEGNEKLLAPHSDERPFTMRSIKLIRDLDQLRMRIEPLKIAVLTVPLREVYHVQLVPAVGEHHVLDSEVSIPKLA